MCDHEDFRADVQVGRLSDVEGGPITAFAAEISVRCAACDEQFVFVGPMPAGILPTEPTVNMDGTELRAPIRPISAPIDFGRDTIGFTVRVIDERPRSN